MASKHGWVIMNPDSVRLALHGQRYLAESEDLVWAVARIMVRSLFLAGHNKVVVDATNIKRYYRDQWRPRTGDCWDRVVHCLIPATKKTCIRRAHKTNDQEIVPVIEKMADQYEPLELDEPLIENEKWYDPV
jgi:predicted kinase